jgi:hypothetical protein
MSRRGGRFVAVDARDADESDRRSFGVRGKAEKGGEEVLRPGKQTSGAVPADQQRTRLWRQQPLRGKRIRGSVGAIRARIMNVREN